MVRLYLLAEGQTEQTFVDTLLKPHLADFGVFLCKPILVATSHKGGQIHRGGGRSYPRMKKDLNRLLAQEQGPDVFFTTMIDVYALYRGFPQRELSNKFKDDPYRRVKFLEDSFGEDIKDRRFIPHLTLHEFEAYLFVDLSRLAEFLEGNPSEASRLGGEVSKYSSPELIDEGSHTAPSKRIIKRFPKYGKAKPVFGPQIAARIGLEAIRANCPHFHQWLDRLENLGGSNPIQ